MTYGVIDVGSNTIRLSVYQTEGKNFRQLFTSKETTGLASYISHHRMEKDGVLCAAAALNKFRSILEQFEIDRTEVFATASLRNIDNSNEVVMELFRETGYQIKVLSGHEEALCDFYGVMYNIYIDTGMIFDIGGGSTELVTFENRKPCTIESAGIGSLNLYNQFVEKIIPKKKELEVMGEKVQQELDELFGCRVLARQTKNKDIIGVGGTVRALLKLVNLYYHLEEKNRCITRNQLEEIFQMATNKQKQIQNMILKICPERVHTIIPGMLVMKSIMEKAGSERIVVSKYGVREGYLYHAILSRDEDKEEIQ